jgi:hypothetical protein
MSNRRLYSRVISKMPEVSIDRGQPSDTGIGRLEVRGITVSSLDAYCGRHERPVFKLSK